MVRIKARLQFVNFNLEMDAFLIDCYVVFDNNFNYIYESRIFFI